MCKNKMKSRKDFEKMLKSAVKSHLDNLPSSEVSDCIGNETLFSLYDGKLPENEEKQVYDHLSRCKGCRTDLRFYSEFVK